MMKMGVNISLIKGIFITHIHGDHSIGAAGLVRTMALNGRVEPLSIFIPKGFESKMRSLISFDKAIIQYEIRIIGVESGKAMEDNGLTISAFKLNHSVSTYGYVLKEEDRRRFIKEKCDRLGVKGIMFSELSKKGITELKGRKIRLGDVSSVAKGRKIAYASDTRPCQSTVRAAAGCDILIHESNFAKADNGLARKRMHSSADEAARMAKLSGAKRLVLTHISARYRKTDALLSDAKRIFRNTSVAYDGFSADV